MHSHIFVSGNRAIIPLIPGLSPSEDFGVTGLVLHGSTSCYDLAGAFITAYEDRARFYEREGRVFYRKYTQFRMVVAGDDLFHTIITAPGGIHSVLKYPGRQLWVDKAEELVLAGDMIKKHERSSQVPVVSSWKQTPGTPPIPVRT